MVDKDSAPALVSPPTNKSAVAKTNSLAENHISLSIPKIVFADYSVFWNSKFGQTRLSGSRETIWVCLLVVRWQERKPGKYASTQIRKPGKYANHAHANTQVRKPGSSFFRWNLTGACSKVPVWACLERTNQLQGAAAGEAWKGWKARHGPGQGLQGTERVCMAWLSWFDLARVLECHPTTAWWGRRLQGWWYRHCTIELCSAQSLFT